METLSIVATLAGTAIETTRIQEERRLAIIARLLGNISHDIKNMLTPILTTAQTLVLIYRNCKTEVEQIRSQVSEEAWQRFNEALQEFDAFFNEAIQMIEGARLKFKSR